jgi:hypothetical protein
MKVTAIASPAVLILTALSIKAMSRSQEAKVGYAAEHVN